MMSMQYSIDQIVASAWTVYEKIENYHSKEIGLKSYAEHPVSYFFIKFSEQMKIHSSSNTCTSIAHFNTYNSAYALYNTYCICK